LSRTSTGLIQFGTDKGNALNGAKLSQLVFAGSAPSVANTSATSCDGTTTATIAGTDHSFVITVGGTAGTSCTVTFNVAAPTRRQCVVNNETTANLARSTYTDTTHSVIAGTFNGGDKLAVNCSVY